MGLTRSLSAPTLTPPMPPLPLRAASFCKYRISLIRANSLGPVVLLVESC